MSDEADDNMPMSVVLSKEEPVLESRLPKGPKTMKTKVWLPRNYVGFFSGGENLCFPWFFLGIQKGIGALTKSTSVDFSSPKASSYKSCRHQELYEVDRVY